MFSDKITYIIIILILVILLLNSPCISKNEYFNDTYGDEDLENINEEDIGEEQFENEDIF